jgi:hypothetical protein
MNELIMYSSDPNLTLARANDEFEASLQILRRVVDTPVDYGKSDTSNVSRFARTQALN